MPPTRAVDVDGVALCPSGHRFDEANSYATPSGYTQCKACRRESRQRNQAVRVAAERQRRRAGLSCHQCRAPINASRSDQRFCSVLCSQVFAGRRNPGPLAVRVCAWSDCTLEFTPKSRRQVCCSEAHGKAYWRDRATATGYRNPKRPYGGARKEADQRRRAIKVGASTAERVVAAEIMERDGWRCGLCRKKIDKRLKWPHPQSASLDHVIPLTRNGAHSPANVQAAHLVCNTAKSNNGGGEQLALIG